MKTWPTFNIIHLFWCDEKKVIPSESFKKLEISQKMALLLPNQIHKSFVHQRLTVSWLLIARNKLSYFWGPKTSTIPSNSISSSLHRMSITVPKTGKLKIVGLFKFNDQNHQFLIILNQRGKLELDVNGFQTILNTLIMINKLFHFRIPKNYLDRNNWNPKL